MGELKQKLAVEEETVNPVLGMNFENRFYIEQSEFQSLTQDESVDEYGVLSVPVHAIVADAQGYKAEFVVVDLAQYEGDYLAIPRDYIRKVEDDHLVFRDVSKANGMVKPRWTGTEWEEMATPEEVEAAHPKPEPSPPTELEQLRADIDYLLMLEGE